MFLRRPSSFDPTRDSIVRVEVGRLRKLLDMYLRGPGASDPIHFEIPRGQSHLKVVRPHVKSGPKKRTGQDPLRLVLMGFWPQVAIALLSTVLILGLAFKLGFMRDQNDNAEVEAALAEEFPRLFVQPFHKYGRVAEAFPRSALSTFVAAELSEFKTFRVIGPSFPSALPVRARDYILEGATLGAATLRTNSLLICV